MAAARLQANFPADFVAEGIDQTRGWFYTLMVLSTALFDKPTFKHLVCNGLVLAADGKKMSKRLQNYPVRLRADARHFLAQLTPTYHLPVRQSTV